MMSVEIEVYVCSICGRVFRHHSGNFEGPPNCQHITKEGILNDNLKLAWNGPIEIYESGGIVVGE